MSFGKRVKRREVETTSVGIIATGSGGLDIASKIRVENTFIYMLHSSEEQLVNASDRAREWTETVMEYVLGCEWKDDRWLPLVDGAGFGAGKDVTAGRAFWDRTRDLIIEDIVNGIRSYHEYTGVFPRILFFIDTLGGGTGTAVWDLPIYLSNAVDRAYRAGTIPMIPAIIGVYTYPASFEPKAMRSNAWEALEGVQAHGGVKNALLIDIDHLWQEKFMDVDTARVFSMIADKVAGMVSDFISLFGNPSAVIEAADVYDVTRPLNPPFGFMSQINPYELDLKSLADNSTAFPRAWKDGDDGVLITRADTAFVGFEFRVTASIQSSVSDFLQSLGATKIITHTVDLNRNNALLLLGSFKLDQLIVPPGIVKARAGGE